MTEQQWLQCGCPTEMLDFIGDSITDRQARLFGVACLRRVTKYMTEPSSLVAIEVAESFADGLATEADLERIGKALLDEYPRRGHDFSFQVWDASRDVVSAARERVLYDTCIHAAVGVPQDFIEEEYAAQCCLLRDIAGNPFAKALPGRSAQAWKNGPVRTLAEVIYQQRSFSQMPRLGDAIEEVGCGDSDILSHCRMPHEHVRGCWVLDLVLGKE